MASGAYSADQNADGSWNVRRVPVLAVHARDGHVVDEAWLLAAVARAAVLQAASYMAPLHVRHHGTGAPTTPAGFVLPVAVERVAYAGRAPEPTVLADLLSIPPAVYEDVRAGRLPYRSVELADLETAEITGLALLADRAPWFQFPLLTVAEHRYARTTTVHYDAREGVTLMQDDMPAGGDASSAIDEAKAAALAALKAVTAQFEAAKVKLSEILAELGVEASAESEAPGDTGDAVGPAEPPAPAAAMSAPIAAHYAAQHAAMSGRVKALEAELAKSRRLAAREAALAGAERELVHYQVTRDELAPHYDAGGAAALAAYSAAVRSRGTVSPPESWTGELPAMGEPEAVTAYALRSPQQLAQARRLATVYAASSAHVRQTPLADYLANQIGAPPARNGAATSGARS